MHRTGRVWLATLAVISVTSAAVAQPQPAAEPRAASAFTWSPTGHVQFDLRSFAHWDLEAGLPRVQRRELELRRARVGFDASWRQLRTEFSVDPFDEDGSWLKDARLELRPRRVLRLHAGHFKLPGGREYATSTRRLGFLERSSLSESLAAGRDLGGQIEWRPTGRVQVDLGAFAGDGTGREDRAGGTLAGRVALEPARDTDLGAYFSLGRTRAGLDTDAPNGINGRTAASFRFFDRLYVEGRRLRIGADVQWSPRRWRVNGEVLRFTDERRRQAADFSDLPTLVAHAAAMSLKWESRRLSVGGRYEWTAFDDTGPDDEFDSVRPRASNVRARSVMAATLTGGWQFASWLTVLGELSSERFGEPRSAPVVGRQGPYLTAALRMQVALP